ncbi:hypothetical protein [Niveibacterium sp. SC-1]|uniref:hypothetical protein n=1 Tax=Niveibacterium sp. SC-1 TaxID=3135646 RepID=UPI00311F814A
MSPALRRALPWAVLGLVLLGLVAAGPVHLPPHYHAFADQRAWAGIPQAADVLSNLAFLLAGLWGVRVMWRSPERPSRAAWWLFAGGVVAVALGSSWYHLAPDDARIVWDRIPIALACAGLSAAVLCERFELLEIEANALTAVLATAATASVLAIDWLGGDLRPYLVLQLVPLLVLPLLQWSHAAPRQERWATSAAALLYLLAKLCELGDAAILAQLQLVSGHTLKHLFSALACATLVAMLARRPERRATSRPLLHEVETQALP